MPREFVLVTGSPSTEEIVRAAAAAMRPALAVRSIWSGGGLEATDGDGTVVVTVLRSSVVEVASAAERVVGAAVPVPAFWTEAYVTGEGPGSRELLDRIAETVNGYVVELGGSA